MKVFVVVFRGVRNCGAACLPNGDGFMGVNRDCGVNRKMGFCDWGLRICEEARLRSAS